MKPARRTPNRHAAGDALRRQSPQPRRLRGLWILVTLVTLGLLAILAARHFDLEGKMAKRGRWSHKLVSLVALHGAGVGAAASAPATLPVPPTTIGLNLSPPAYFRQNRAFANLALGSSSWLSGAERPDPNDLDADGYMKRLTNDKAVTKALMQPTDKKEATIRCTYQGHGDIRPARWSADQKPGSFTFYWRNTGYKTSAIILRLSSVDPANPIRNLDCREVDMPANLRFAPQFLEMLRPFKVIRFMDWQNVNNNKPVTWSTRHTPNTLQIIDGDGVSIEDMVELVNEVGADPWFNIPWNADDNYIRRFAQYVHDHLGKDHKVYVEVGNEVWNAHFPMSKQSLAEGMSEGLHSNPEVARLYRYAERVSQVMPIWANVFADRPRQLVRVANCQNGPNRSKLVLAYKDTAKNVDALATAPYFGGDFRKHPPANLDEAFARLNDSMDESLKVALLSKGTAAAFGKRYIAYEAGQHVVLNDADMAQQVQRDPRMFDAYKRYLSIWREKIGDTIMMYDSVQPVAQRDRTGSFGLMEYAGQPLTDAPKMRAVVETIRESGH
jgi:hypothetical protein